VLGDESNVCIGCVACQGLPHWLAQRQQAAWLGFDPGADSVAMRRVGAEMERKLQRDAIAQSSQFMEANLKLCTRA